MKFRDVLAFPFLIMGMILIITSFYIGGSWTTNIFVEAIFDSLKKHKIIE